MRDDGGGLGAFEGEGRELVGGVFESDVVHDDEFVEHLNDFFAYGRVSADQELFFERVDFEFGENVALGIEEQGEGAGAFAQGFDVVRDDRVEVADAVGAGESEGGVPVGVEQGDGFAGGAVFGVEIGEGGGESAAEVVGEGGAFGEFELGEGGVHWSL